MNLRKRQNIMVGAMYTAFAYYWLVQIYYYMRWGCNSLLIQSTSEKTKRSLVLYNPTLSTQESSMLILSNV